MQPIVLLCMLKLYSVIKPEGLIPRVYGRHAWNNYYLIQGVVTPIGPVLTTATAVKVRSSGQG